MRCWWPKRQNVAEKLEAGLAAFSARERHLPGMVDLAARCSLAMQMVASLRRLDYTEKLRKRPISPGRANPEKALFDPERAAMLHAWEGRVDEAFWLIFLATHFGKHPTQGWERLRDVYSGLGTGIWTWDRTSGDPAAFRLWLRENELSNDIRNWSGGDMRNWPCWVMRWVRVPVRPSAEGRTGAFRAGGSCRRGW